MSNYRPITDVWILARPKVKYYGAYPNGFLERARSLLGVSPFEPVLHVCAGMARAYPAKPRGFGPNDKTLDLTPLFKPDFLQSASEPLPCQNGHGCSGRRSCDWPALIADPPYSEIDADHYEPGRKHLPSANQLLRNMLSVVRLGGRVGLLHYVLPQPPKDKAKFVACVGVIVGFNNRMRVYSVFERTA